METSVLKERVFNTKTTGLDQYSDDKAPPAKQQQRDKENLQTELLQKLATLETELNSKNSQIESMQQQIQEQSDYIAEHFARGDGLADRCDTLAAELDETRRVKLTQEIENVKLKNNLAQLEQKVMLMDSQIQAFEYEQRRERTRTRTTSTRRNSYTERVPLEQRITEAEELAKKHPNCVPIILEPPTSGSSMALQLGFEQQNFQRKLLLPGSFNFKQCCQMMNKHLLDSKAIKLDQAKDVLYFYVNRDFSTVLLNEQLSTIYRNHRHADGFLYVNFAKEATFG